MQGDVHLALRPGRILLNVGILGADLIEITQLIQAQEAVLPGVAVEAAAFGHHQFAANHLVAGGGVAGELDAMNVEGLALLHVHRQVHHMGLFVRFRIGVGDKVDVAELSVQFAQIFQAFAQFGDVQHLPRLHAEDVKQKLVVGDELVMQEGDLADVIPVAFDHRDVDVDLLAGVPAPEEDMHALGTAQLQRRVFHQGLKVSTILIGGADFFEILRELGLVVSLAEEAFKDEGVGNPNGTQLLHAFAQRAGTEHLVTGEGDVAHLDLGALIHVKRQLHRTGRQRRGSSLDGGVLAPMLGEQFLDGHFGMFHDGRIVGAVHREAHVTRLVAIQNVGLRDRLQALVLDAANERLFLNDHVQQDAARGVFAFDANIVKKAGVPQRHEVPVDLGRIINVTDARKNAGTDGLAGNAVVAFTIDAHHHMGGLLRRWRLRLRLPMQPGRQAQEQANHPQGTNHLAWHEPERAGRRCVVDHHGRNNFLCA